MQKRALPFLHAFDRCKPSNSALNLACIWWKAMSGNDRSSPVYDEGLSYAMLPSVSRVAYLSFRRFYPRLHHANVEIRTAFLDKSVREIVEEARSRNRKTKIRLVSMGAGYDVRSIKFLSKGLVDSAYELDLPQVIEAKQRLLRRAQRRKKDLLDKFLPQAFAVDLNDSSAVRNILTDIVAGNYDEYCDGVKSSNEEPTETIILFEAVMIYLNENKPTELLEICSSVCKSQNLNDSSHHTSLVFADRLENIPGGDYDIGKEVLASLGWNIVEWLPKPGLARHMGRAEIVDI